MNINKTQIMSRSLVFVLCLLQLALLIAANDYYSVVGPGTIRSNSKYNVAVTMHKARSILAKLVRQNLIDVSISGPSFNETKRVEVGHDSTEIVEFDVPTLAKGEYNLTAVGVEGVIFRNSTTLNVADNNPLIFIQTDKAIYKPGDRVQYRVLFLNESTRPAVVDEPITVTIIDQGGNRVKQVANITLTKGVYAGQLSLTAEPMFGKWVIKVTVAGATKFFEVAKYVLPKFEVKIEAMRDIAVQDGVIRAIVRAQHTHGQPLKGTANVSISPSYNSFRPSESAINQQKTIEIVGKGEVEFVIDAKDFSGHYTPPLMIFAEVTETLTGNKQNASVIINVHLQRLNLEAINNKATYRPGQPFIYEFVVKNLDGSPVQDNVTIAKLIFEPPNKFFNEDATAQPDKDTLQFEATLNKHGIARFNISLAANEDRFFSVKAAFANSSAYLGSIANFRPDIDSDEPLLIQVKTEKPKLEEDVEIEVKSDENIPYIVYTIVARGNIVKTEHVRVSRILTKHKSYTFKLTPTFAMVPQASIYVFYILNDDLHFVEETIHFEKQLENSIKITAPIEVEPNQEVKLQIKTEADSFVGLLAVDQSVLLLKAGNDLARDSIFNGLDKYKTTTPWQQGYGRYPGQASGLVTLTNAHYPYNSVKRVVIDDGGDLGFDTVDGRVPSKSYRKNFAEVWIFEGGNLRWAIAITKKLDSGLIPIMKVSGDSKNNTTKIKSTQNHTNSKPQSTEESISGVQQTVIETWIYAENLTKNADGNIFELTKKAPDTLTSWVVTGFALSPNKGLALTEEPSLVRVFKPFFIALNSPDSMTLGKNIAGRGCFVPIEFRGGSTNHVTKRQADQGRYVRNISIPANSGNSVSFMIRPISAGASTLNIGALSPAAGDSISRPIRVQPTGELHRENREVLLILEESVEVSQELWIEVPGQTTMDYIEICVMGDILGPVFGNLRRLLDYDHNACGEQNMINFVPNIMVLQYLDATDKNMPNLKSDAEYYMELGYQHELTYKLSNGAYSLWGPKNDGPGSTWLTAYVMQSFHQAKPYTYVDPNTLWEGLNFLREQQVDYHGSFQEDGKNNDFSPGSHLALASFVLLAFLENEEFYSEFQQTIENGVRYVATGAYDDQYDDLHSQMLAANVLGRAGHSELGQIMEKLLARARKSDEQMWWVPEGSGSTAIQCTAYGLMALLDYKHAQESLPIVKWLVGQRNSFGGYDNSLDTVLALQALTKFAIKTGASDNTVIEYTTDGNLESKATLIVNPDGDARQCQSLESNTRVVQFYAAQKGMAILQLHYQYYAHPFNNKKKRQATNSTGHHYEKKPSFKITPNVKDTPAHLLELEICAEYAPPGCSNQTKNSFMVVMEVSMPSGFVGEVDSFDKMLALRDVNHVETKEKGTKVVIYFGPLKPGVVLCVPVEGARAHLVAEPKPARILMYDYYQTEHRATEYYEISTSFCDICEGAECGSDCDKKQST
ncbi:CD109 antigen [Drosophila busckii]|uniref:CD109 antigen n=1 Tax=Drosophila busckii TaxID=30019 RepID=UPI001433411A|nr:CD109 antigen [Drosophila busckii]